MWQLKSCFQTPWSLAIFHFVNNDEQLDWPTKLLLVQVLFFAIFWWLKILHDQSKQERGFRCQCQPKYTLYTLTNFAFVVLNCILVWKWQFCVIFLSIDVANLSQFAYTVIDSVSSKFLNCWCYQYIYHFLCNHAFLQHFLKSALIWMHHKRDSYMHDV